MQRWILEDPELNLHLLPGWGASQIINPSSFTLYFLLFVVCRSCKMWRISPAAMKRFVHFVLMEVVLLGVEPNLVVTARRFRPEEMGDWEFFRLKKAGSVAYFFTQLAVLLIYQVQSLPSFGDCMILTTYYQNQNASMRTRMIRWECQGSLGQNAKCSQSPRRVDSGLV